MSKVKHIDPMIGTVGDDNEKSFHGGGKTHPGACYPFGMVQLSPDTTTSGDNGTGYHYCQDTIEGFSFNHMSGIGWYGDLGNLQIMPIKGITDLRSGSNLEVPFKKGTYGWRSPFLHENEIAKAGYYSVKLDRYEILCEATVSCHTGMLRFTYPQDKESGIIFNFSRRIAGRSNAQDVEIDGNYIRGCITCDHEFGGFGRGDGNIDYKLYFCLELSKTPKTVRFFENEIFLDTDIKRICGEDLHLLVTFETEKDEQILVRCGISYVDGEGARNNLECECPDFDFDSVLKKVTDAWDKALSCISAEGSDNTDMTLFYTCLYHTLLDPRTAVDADGRYSDSKGKVHKATYTHRTMFSGWDVYRSEFPLLTLISPKTVNDEINSLLNIALEKNSSFPKWELMGIDSKCMVGDPGLIVMADAYLKGIRNFDIEKAYDIAFASATAAEELYGKPFENLHPTVEQYRKHAYVPDKLSDTLEFLLADYTMSQLAFNLGKAEDHKYFLDRANSYTYNYNKDLGFMAPRDDNGDFLNIKDKYDETGCVESNIYQQSMFIPYDVEGLSRLFGKDRLIALLEELFEKADLGALWNDNYNHSNEPCHNLTHYFNVLGMPERTQYWTREVQKKAYRLGAYGFCGNEDVGQLSAWYVLSAMGLAQICMADDRYYINTPLFKRITVRLDPQYHSCQTADTLTVICDNDPLEYPYIDSIFFNGKRVDRTYITYNELTAGGILEFKLTN